MMSISANFNVFCDKLKVSTKKKSIISLRYNSICKKLNNDFWDINTYCGGIYVGCYGRETANNSTETIEMLFEMPSRMYQLYSDKPNNGQFLFLEDVRRSISAIYPNTVIEQDSLEIKVCFFDKMCFKITPVFFKENNTHIYADPRKGGTWETKNFSKEKQSTTMLNLAANDNHKRLCRMAKIWKKNAKVPISDMLIDTQAYEFLLFWRYRNKSYSYYDAMCKDFFKYLMEQKPLKKDWKAIGDFLVIPNTFNFRYKAIIAHEKAVRAMTFSKNNQQWLAAQKWKEIFGSEFPDTIVVENQLNTLEENASKTYESQKKRVKVLTGQRYLFVTLQVLFALTIPIALLVIEYTPYLYLGTSLFITAILCFTISLVYGRTNKYNTILRYKVSAKLALRVKEQIHQLILDLNTHDVDVALIREKKKEAASKLRNIYRGTSSKISKGCIETFEKLKNSAIIDTSQKSSIISASNMAMAERSKHKLYKSTVYNI
ncbi:hypothetical protein [Aquimarina sp. AU474]|uniref:SMODS domain-containing nucleotidyltransferase n=1 Tax=Aquimarina sp. AU474 TaxID=2108529 RepID=UPI000D696454|nr:hypothetical protein [Aquimarina sp. AU474]